MDLDIGKITTYSDTAYTPPVPEDSTHHGVGGCGENFVTVVHLLVDNTSTTWRAYGIVKTESPHRCSGGGQQQAPVSRKTSELHAVESHYTHSD